MSERFEGVTKSKPDLLLFAGPVFVPKSWKIDWYGRQVVIGVIPGSGSNTFKNVWYDAPKGPGQSVLPYLAKRFGRRELEEFDQVACSSYSAGWGLLNEMAKHEADRHRITAYVLLDSAFDGGDPRTGATGGPPLQGYLSFAEEAARGERLMVATTAHTSPGGFLTGRQSWAKVYDAVKEQGFRERVVEPRPPAPPASGGWKQLGDSLLWGDYTEPGSAWNEGNDFTHQEHATKLPPLIWQAYLAPWLAGERFDPPFEVFGVPWQTPALGAAFGVALGLTLRGLQASQRRR